MASSLAPYFGQRRCPPPEDLVETSSSLRVFVIVFGQSQYVELSWPQTLGSPAFILMKFTGAPGFLLALLIHKTFSPPS